MDSVEFAEICRKSVASLGCRGKHIQVGLTTVAERGEIALRTDAMVINEVSFLYTAGMQVTRFGDVLSAVEQGVLQPSLVIGETIGLGGVGEKLAAMTEVASERIHLVTEFDTRSCG